MKRLFNCIFYWREIRLLRKLRKYTIMWHNNDLNAFTIPGKRLKRLRRLFDGEPRCIGMGLCSVLFHMNDINVISDKQYIKSQRLIEQYRDKLAYSIEGSLPPESVFFFIRGALKPRIEYIDAIINELKNK